MSPGQRARPTPSDAAVAPKLRSDQMETSAVFQPPPGIDDAIPLPAPGDPTPYPIASPPPDPAPLPDTLADQLRAAPTSPAPYRPHRIPILTQEPEDPLAHGALLARFTWPLRLVGAGVAISLVDFVLRQAELPLPIRPIWVAELFVVAGVIWAFVVVFVSSRDA